jgi:hypothetical protein
LKCFRLLSNGFAKNEEPAILTIIVTFTDRLDMPAQRRCLLTCFWQWMFIGARFVGFQRDNDKGEKSNMTLEAGLNPIGRVFFLQSLITAACHLLNPEHLLRNGSLE